MEHNASAGTTPAVKRIVVETIPHDQQLYDTVGDWRFEPQTGTLVVLVSDFGDWRASMAVALHEQTEAMLCILRGVTEESVSNWDLEHLDSDDPGNIPEAPYHMEHRTAMHVEYIFAIEAYPEVKAYDATLDKLILDQYSPYPVDPSAAAVHRGEYD